ncbi:benzoate/H(+) symporter BenE family transporter [Deinococcus knuensis]|uniref:Benzoate transporter n=1 Tax=Deinococcus knuensis TaxID=1837380 RepID=A0ABQ2SIG6_9DEIO|nr:benzoate/H(+) symporter BenE family transporter [Deinococcus knuensis]GGS27474.1 benzoate transporter [Deinococcus knuensis]
MTVMPAPSRSFWQDSNSGAVLSGLITMLIGWAGPNVLIYSVAQAAHLSDGAAMSWLWAHALLAGLTGIVLSLRTRMPVLITWSTPGIAFLVTALPGIPFPEAVGAFITSGVLVVLLGTFGPLTRALQGIPAPLAAALNAAILLPFGFRALQAFGTAPALVGVMILAYFALRQLAPRWAVAGVLVAGVVASAALNLWHPAPVTLALTRPEFVAPAFSLHATLNLALPLTLLAFTGQFVPGFGVLKTNGYEPAPGPVLRACGAASVAAAFAGCHNLTLGALLANIVSGPEAHPDAQRRYTAAVWAGVFNIAVGLFAGTFLHLMGILPAQAIAALAGLALLSAVGSSLQGAFQGVAAGSLAAPVVLLVTLSGITPLGVGAAFWGILAGLAVHWTERRRPAPARLSVPPRPAPATDAQPDT